LVIPQTKDVFVHNPNVNAIVTFNKRNPLYKILSFFAVIKTLKHIKYDVALSVQSSYTSSLIMYLSKIPERIGFNPQKLLTKSIDYKRDRLVIERYLNLLTLFSDKSFSIQTDLFWQNSIESETDLITDKIDTDDKILIGIAPGSVWKTKRWPPEYYSELIRQLNQYQVKVILIGGKEDESLCQRIAESSGKYPINMAGRLSILGSAALIKRFDLLISNDSAPLHIANAVQTDVIAIFGPTVERFGCYPYRQRDKVIEIDIPCRPCRRHGSNSCPERHFKCMRDITPEIVLSAIRNKFDLVMKKEIED